MNINVGIIGTPAFAARFGKKGTESDITLYNYRKDENTITFIHPTRYPEKLSSLFFVLEQCDMIIMEIAEINANLGELIVAMDAAMIERGYIYLTNNLIPEQINPLLHNTSVSQFMVTDLPPPELKELLLDEYIPSHLSGNTTIPIDHHFNVKGIGPVVLGIVRSGSVKKHQKLVLFPSGKEILIRSIQTHDKDVNLAEEGERVGLALKGIETLELDRGMVLADPDSGIRTGDHLRIQLKVNSYWKLPIVDEMVFHLSTFMQMKPGRIHEIRKISSNKGDQGDVVFSINFHRPMIYHPDSPIFVSYLEGGKLRVVGRGKVVED